MGGVTDDDLDVMARKVGLQLDVMLARYEIEHGLLAEGSVKSRIDILAKAYGYPFVEMATLIGADW